MEQIEKDIIIDKCGRIPVTGDLDFSFKSISGIFNISELELLSSDCELVFSSKKVKNVDSYSTGSTYFINANASPRCLLEEFAQLIYKMHTSNATFDALTSGAEWWVNVVDPDDDIGVHWDRDYGIEETYGMHIYPQLATVTYLSDVGGPTIIYDKPGTFCADDEIKGTISSCIISQPKVNKHIVFDGLLLHAAPSEIEPNLLDDSKEDDEVEELQSMKKRITFLVNIWCNHLPSQSNLLPKSILKHLHPPSNTSSKKNIFCLSSATENPIGMIECNEINYKKNWSFHHNEKPYSLQVIFPKHEELINELDKSTSKCVKITYNEGKYIDLVEGEEEEEVDDDVSNEDNDEEEETEEDSNEEKNEVEQEQDKIMEEKIVSTGKVFSRKRTRQSINASVETTIVEKISDKRRR